MYGKYTRENFKQRLYGPKNIDNHGNKQIYMVWQVVKKEINRDALLCAQRSYQIDKRYQRKGWLQPIFSEAKADNRIRVDKEIDREGSR